MKKRKIIQILLAPKESIEEGSRAVLYALCDDGTVWWRNEGEGRVWQQDNTDLVEEI